MNTRSGGEVAVRVNGELRALPAGSTVAALVLGATSGDAPAGEARGVAVARNSEIVPRAEWATTALAEGDAIEIVRPVQGG